SRAANEPSRNRCPHSQRKPSASWPRRFGRGLGSRSSWNGVCIASREPSENTYGDRVDEEPMVDSACLLATRGSPDSAEGRAPPSPLRGSLTPQSAEAGLAGRSQPREERACLV